MYPRDYYHHENDKPHLRNIGEGRPYLDPNWHANNVGPQLPSLSTIGRGPRGEGLTVGNVVNEDDTVSFALYSTLTGELVWQSPNLAPSKIEFLPADFRDLAAGQPAPMDIKVTRGGVTETTHAYLPCGEQGSLIYTLDQVIAKNNSQTYQTTVNDLIIYGNQYWNNGHKPMPKVNDIIMVKLQEGDNVVLAIADIVQVGSTSEDEIALDSPVVYIVRTMIDNVGPKGDKGDPGSQVHVWEAEGNWYPYVTSYDLGVSRMYYRDEDDCDMPLAFICHVTSLDQFIPMSFYVSTYYPFDDGWKEMFMNGSIASCYKLIPLSYIFTEWAGPSYVYATVDDGYDIYFCPFDNHEIVLSTENDLNEFLESYPTYKMYGTYMLDEEYEHPTVINGYDLRTLPDPM